MRLAFIKDRHMFNKNANYKDRHLYAVYYDKKSKKYRAIETTHLFLPDKKRFSDIKKGHLKKVKFPNFELPSGVNNNYYETDINGKSININHPDIKLISKKHLPKNVANDIISFAKTKRR